MNLPAPNYFFLCGVGRSGTTILRTGLGTHEQIYYNGFENNVVQDVVEVALKNCTMPSRKNSMAVDQSEYDSHFKNLICELIWPDKELSKRPIHMAAINPSPKQLEYLQQLFLQCRFAGLVRNGIEVVSSRMEYKSFSGGDFESHCEVWNRSAEVYDWGRQNGECFFAIRHEWFYEPEQLTHQLESLFDWLSIEHSAAPEELILGTLRHPTSAEQDIERREFRKSAVNEKRKYFQSKRERWKSWTDQQKDVFASRCGANMGRLGYKIPWC